ncbi:MAG: hypothetical protein RL291_1859 [Pseudomonadota bacterium]
MVERASTSRSGTPSTGCRLTRRAEKTFIHRLMQENRWSEATATADYGEYLKFHYLAGTVGHKVTPSETADRAWHLQMVHARHYWDTLCGAILKRKLHHEPSAGGAVEATTYNMQYRVTLEANRKAFGIEAPTAIWPRPDTRKLVKDFSGTGYVVAAFVALGLTLLGWLPAAFFALALLLIGLHALQRYEFADRVPEHEKGRRRSQSSGGGSGDGWVTGGGDGGASCGGGCGGGCGG